MRIVFSFLMIYLSSSTAISNDLITDKMLEYLRSERFEVRPLPNLQASNCVEKIEAARETTLGDSSSLKLGAMVGAFQGLQNIKEWIEEALEASTELGRQTKGWSPKNNESFGLILKKYLKQIEESNANGEHIFRALNSLTKELEEIGISENTTRELLQQLAELRESAVHTYNEIQRHHRAVVEAAANNNFGETVYFLVDGNGKRIEGTGHQIMFESNKRALERTLQKVKELERSAVGRLQKLVISSNAVAACTRGLQTLGKNACGMFSVSVLAILELLSSPEALSAADLTSHYTSDSVLYGNTDPKVICKFAFSDPAKKEQLAKKLGIVRAFGRNRVARASSKYEHRGKTLR